MNKKILTLFFALLASCVAWAQNTWTVENLSGRTFTVTRTNTAVADTVLYRTVNISAVTGRHYQAATGTLTFDVGEPSKTVAVTELNPGNNAYSYQTGTQRSYRFEVTDLGGFHLAHCDRSFTTGNSVPGSGMFDIKDVTISNSQFAADDDGYDANGYKSVPSTYYCTNGTKSYLAFLGAQLRMTLSFEAREVDDAYEYLQLLVDNTNTCDNRNGCSNGDPGNINLSLYMAGFEMHTSSTDTTFRSYTFPVTSVGYNASATDPWGYGNKYPLTKQKFNSSCRATDGRLIIPNSFSTLVLRLNASGTVGSDQWVARNIKAHIQAVDTHNPTVSAVTVAPGKHAKGDTVYVSVAFNEIVTVTGTPTLSTNNSWGTLNYIGGSGSNVLTFRGIIPANASNNLIISNLSGTVSDLAGNNFTWSGSYNTSCPLDASYNYPITYDLAGGSLATANRANYTWETATFTLTNPTREHYDFAGWTGTGLDAATTSVTIAQGSHGDRTYTATWTPHNYTITYNLGGGTADNPATYNIETATFTLANPTRTGYTFAGWTGTGLSTPTSDLTIELGSSGNRSYTATWTPITYNLTYDLAGGSVATPNPDTYTIETADFTLVNPTREHYDFAGWTGTGLDAATTSVTVTQGSHGDRSYTAHWTPITYNISYDLDGGSVATPNPDTYTVETPEFTLNTPTREGYTFAGWTGTGLDAATQTVTIAQGSTGHRSYTANWEIITYNITYDYGIDGVSASNPATYTVETPTFTLTNPSEPTGCFFLGWTGTGLDAATQTVTIAQGSTGDRSYTATWNNLWGVDADHDGTTAERAYVITTPEGLNHLATLVNGGNGFSGTFFKLGADIAYTYASQWDDAESNENNYTSIGTLVINNVRSFRGTFDGCGHTVSGIRVNADDDSKGLFGYISGGTVRNVILSDSRITGRLDVGGIVGENFHGTVENCHATATVAIYSRGNGPGYHGGIVGRNNGTNATATVVGCTSAATVSGTGNNYGGVVGYNYFATVSRCLALGAVVTAGSFFGPVVGGGTVTDCHHRRCTVGGNAQNDLYAVVAGTGVTLAPSGAATVAYPYGGLQLYGSAFLCGDTLYAPANASVGLTLSYSGSGNLMATTGTLSGTANPYTLTMPDQDVIIILDHWGIAASAAGTQEHPYLITTPEGLELLASQVNSGNPFSGTFFKLGANIDLDGYSIPPIGDYSQSRPFQGSLDGDNYTITNMSLAGGDCQGLFGYLAGGRVENLTVSNATLSGNGDYRGVVCGYNLGGTLQNCQVTGSSLADSGQYVGGVVGGTFGGAVVSNCQCTSTTIDITGDFVGGVAGIAANTTIVNCTASAAVGGINQVGGIVGLLGPDAHLEGCTNSGLVRGIAQVGGLVGYQRAGSGQCSGSNSGNVRWSAMGGGVCGHAEDTTMLEGCSSMMTMSYDTIRIGDWENLREFRDNVNNGSNSYEGIVIVLDWNLNLGNGWTPIGTPEHPFRGIFDGQDHTINFGIYNESNDYQGFFGYMQGTVKNVNFTQCSVIGRNYVGVIAGYCHGTISNCYSYREKVEGEKYVGGLVGMASYSEIQDCFNGNNIVGGQYVGGIVGDFVDSPDTARHPLSTDLYGGNVSRCYNYGMVRATGDTSHVGGIAGFTSAEVKHCYNSGIVDGKDFVGGLCGQLDGDNLHHCYNAGHVSATGNNKGAVCGSLNLQDIIYNCFYDRQMCTVQDNNASGYNTLKMTGTALRNALGTDYWSYHDNEYPTLKTTKKDSTYFRISVKPLLLPGNMPVDKVVQPFCGVTGNAPYSHVEWSRYGTATETVDTIHLADKDSITLLGCGVDTLKVSHPGYGFERLVPIVVAAREATVETVHTCGSIYKWNKNNQYYYETGFYTCDTCANKQALDLTITPVTITPTPINSTCETIPDGAVLVSVTGGPGNGFRYLWTNSYTGDSIGNTPALTDITAGYYSVTVTDSLYSTCSQTSPINLTAVAPVALTIKSCDASKTYDGTALTGNRYVVTEEGFEPDTLPADSFAVLSNGDTLRVTFDSNAVNAGTYENKFTYSISNGIDHSCHYTVTTATGSLTVTPRPVVIVVDDASKEFGDEDPTFTGSVADLVNEGDLGTITYSRENSSVQAIGNYPDVLTASYTTNPNYSVSINKGDFLINCRRLTTRISNWPEAEITGIDECFYPAANNLPSPNTAPLPTADQIRTWIAESNNLQDTDFTMAIKDSAIRSSACDWQWARIFTLSADTNNGYCDVESRVLYVSGGDQTAPVHSNNYLWIDGTVYQDACLASFNIDLFFPKDQDLFDDCSQMTITHKDTNTGDDHYGWTIRRSYVVTDACGHTIYDTIEVSGRDMTPPVAAHDTLWSALATNLSDSILVIHDIAQLKTLFGISDACTGEDVTLVSSSKTLKTGEQCTDTLVIAYEVADTYGNPATVYQAQLVKDTTGPTFDIPHDTTLCVDPDGNYENTVTRVAAEITITNLHDNCTRLQGSFSVQSSMDTSRFNFYHPRGYRITQGESDNGVRHYKQLWTVTDSCGNTTCDSIAIHVRPLPKITQITIPNQNIIYGDAIRDVRIYHQYSDLSITGSSGIGLDSLGCSVEHKKDQNNNEYDRVYGDPEFAVSNATFLVTATSHQGWGCSIDSSTFSITVEPRPIDITATDATKKYDGTPLTSNNYTCTTNDNEPALVHEDVISRLSFSGSQTDVGSRENIPGNAKITAPNDTTIDKTSNYWIEYYNGTLTVTANDTAITVTAGSGSRFYDGTPFTLASHDDFIVTGVPDALTWTATADGTVTNIIPGEGEKPLNEVTSFHIFDADGHDVTEYFTNITYQSGTLTVNPVAISIGDGWQAIATPVHDEGETYWTVSSVFTTAPYDLFRYDEPTVTWQNYKSHFFTFSPARGYIYRTATDEALIYDGMPNSEASYSIALTAGAPNDMAGWNLVGNPYPFPVHLDCPYYGLRPDGSWEAHVAPVATDSLAMGQAVLVHTTAPATLTFYYATRSTTAPAQAKGPLPALPKGLCLSGDCDDPRNNASTQSHNHSFAHLDGDRLIVDGEGTLEAYDMMGRRLFSREANSDLRLPTSDFPGTGVYILRLAGQSQKIVITK